MTPVAAHRWKVAILTAALGSVFVPVVVWAWNAKLDVAAFDLYEAKRQAEWEKKLLMDSVRFAELARIAREIKCNPVLQPSPRDEDCFKR